MKASKNYVFVCVAVVIAAVAIVSSATAGANYSIYLPNIELRDIGDAMLLDGVCSTAYPPPGEDGVCVNWTHTPTSTKTPGPWLWYTRTPHVTPTLTVVPPVDVSTAEPGVYVTQTALSKTATKKPPE